MWHFWKGRLWEKKSREKETSKVQWRGAYDHGKQVYVWELTTISEGKRTAPDITPSLRMCFPQHIELLQL